MWLLLLRKPHPWYPCVQHVSLILHRAIHEPTLQHGVKKKEKWKTRQKKLKTVSYQSVFAYLLELILGSSMLRLLWFFDRKQLFAIDWKTVWKDAIMVPHQAANYDLCWSSSGRKMVLSEVPKRRIKSK